MSKNFTAFVAIVILCVSILSFGSFYNNYSTKSASADKANSSKNRAKKQIRIVDGEIDIEPNIKLNKKQQERFQNCQQEVSKKRTRKYKNKPTPCVKEPIQVNDHITDEDYNILWEEVNQQVEITKGEDIPKKFRLMIF